MGLFKKKAVQTEPEKSVRKSGRSLLVYFLPSVLVAVVLMLVMMLLAQQTIRSGASASARSGAQTAAAALASRLEGVVTARRELLTLAVSDGRAAAALAAGDGEAIRAAVADLQRRVPGVLQIRLLPPDASAPDPTGAAPLGYAGLDMLRRTLDSGRPSTAEVHQIKSGEPYLAMALPVRADGGIAGALFAAWDLDSLTSLVENSPKFPGRLQLTQGGDGGFALAKGPGSFEGDLRGGSVDVPATIWKVDYAVAPEASGLGDFVTMLALLVGGGLALLLSVFLQWRMLGGDLRADMITMVELGEAIMRGEGAAARRAHLGAANDAIALLSQYARESRERGPAVVAKRAVPAGVPAEQQTQGVEVEELDSDPAEMLASNAGKKSPAAKARALSAADRPQIELAENLFRAYDIRGVVGESLTPAVAELLGQALATLVQEQDGYKVAVARDARLTSPELSTALIRGLTGGGCDVLDIGQAPTPLLYFAIQTQPVHAGVMVTGSHNPTNYNGFKVVLGDRVLDGDDLLALRKRMLEGDLSQGSGSVERLDLLSEYVEAALREVQLARPLKVVVDAGNGVAGDLAIATFEALGCEVVPLFCEPDGSFPNHHPDPSLPDNLASLMLEVQAQEADLGIAFDGDGDRLGVIDNTGQSVWPDSVLMLLAADVLGRHPGVDILYDVKSSRHLASFILAHGGRPIMWKCGHSRMRAKMLETGALLGGEFSGHLFIKERWYGFDDAIYAGARLLEIMALEPRSASELFAELPSSPATPEYQLMLEEGQSRDLMRALDAHKVFDDARLVELDGLRVEFANGWGLIRPSNTTPSLTFRFEADDERALEDIKARFRDLLRRVAPDMQAPF